MSYGLGALVFAIAVCARGLYYAGRELRRYLKSPTRRERAEARRRLGQGVDALREGERVAITGTVHAIDAHISAALSGKPCVCYLALADIYWRNELGAFEHDREVRESAMTSFVLDTKHGRIVIDGDHATVELPAAPVIPRRIELERAFLGRHLTGPGTRIGRDLREIAIEEGDRISVAGVVAVTRDDSAEHGYRDAPMKMRLVADEKFPLTIGKPR
ncbi:MAG: hypothetical protein HOV81_40750 [Kofleriaceae bacterium]|nr:hypothetical protein [Kofleriaceae bacterium]